MPEDTISNTNNTFEYISTTTIASIQDPVEYNWNIMSTDTNTYKDEMKDGKIKAGDGNYYPKEECIIVSGNYWWKNDPNLIKDDIDGDLVHKSSCLLFIKEMIIKDGKVSEPIIHGFTKRFNIDNKTIPFYSDKLGYEGRVASIDAIKGWDYKECFERGCYVDKSMLSKPIDKVKSYEPFKNTISITDDIKQKIKLGIVSPSHILTEGLKYTFGVELECSRGFIPRWLANSKYNLLCVRDGSLNPGEENGGPEYVTGVLTGDTGINHLQDICLELSRRTRVNKSCGLHLHLGNIDFNKKFIINSYRLAMFLENEIAETLPYSRRDNPYCKKIKRFTLDKAIGGTVESDIKINEDYNALFKYISYEKANNPTFEYNKTKQHPLGAKCGYNHSTPRYCWINYVPAMFNTRGNGSLSLEIRNHSGTTNFNKIKNWLLFFMAFMAFAERYPQLIEEGIRINDVINKMLPRNSKVLVDYFNGRKLLFSRGDNEDTEYTVTKGEDNKKSIKELINN